MELLREIVHCPNVEICRTNSQQSHPCAAIVGLQMSKSKEDYQVPELWSGHLEQARILFLSSNPSISETEEYPRGDWLDNKIEDYFVNRFGGGKKEWIKDGIHGLQRDGSYGKATRFWVAVRKHASDLLEKDIRSVRPGLDYALTEVVHCKSLEEEGVRQAFKECAKRYLRRVLELSGARVIVVLGSTIREVVRDELGITQDASMQGPMKIGDIERYLAFLPHPNAHGYRSFERCMPEQLPQLQVALRQ